MEKVILEMKNLIIIEFKIEKYVIDVELQFIVLVGLEKDSYGKCVMLLSFAIVKNIIICYNRQNYNNVAYHVAVSSIY